MKLILDNKYHLLLALLIIILVRIFLINYNVAEWGDSYNLLIAGESLKDFHYPVTEKRLPLLPIFLSFNSGVIEPLLWGRIVVLILSVGSIYITVRLYQLLSFKKRLAPFLAVFVALQPLFAYWSMRIMTDVLFAFLILLSFYYYSSRLKSNLASHVVLGLIVGLAAVTRFEGFILVGVFALVTLYRENVSRLLFLTTTVGLVVLPLFARNFLLFGTLFYSPYTGEASSYIPDIRLLSVFLTYLIFLIGPLTPFFLKKGMASALGTDKMRIMLPIIIFMALYAPLIAIWTAAIPRLFYSFVPLFSIILFLGLEATTNISRQDLIKIALGFVFLVVSGALLRIDFLIGSVGSALLVGTLSFLAFGVLILRHMNRFSQNQYLTGFITLVILTNTVVTISVLSQARESFSTTVYAAEYVQKLNGTVGYADETGVSSWYLRNKGEYFDNGSGITEGLAWMRDRSIKYLVVTNEHYEEGGSFIFVYDPSEQHRFRLMQRFERDQNTEPFNKLLARLGLHRESGVELKYSEVYEVVSYD